MYRYNPTSQEPSINRLCKMSVGSLLSCKKPHLHLQGGGRSRCTQRRGRGWGLAVPRVWMPGGGGGSGSRLGAAIPRCSSRLQLTQGVRMLVRVSHPWKMRFLADPFLIMIVSWLLQVTRSRRSLRMTPGSVGSFPRDPWEGTDVALARRVPALAAWPQPTLPTELGLAQFKVQSFWNEPSNSFLKPRQHAVRC